MPYISSTTDRQVIAHDHRGMVASDIAHNLGLNLEIVKLILKHKEETKRVPVGVVGFADL